MIDEVKDFIDQHCIYRAKPGELIPGKYPGQANTWNTFLRRLTHNPKHLKTVSNYLAIIIDRDYANTHPRKIQLCGMETSSLPLIAGIQESLQSIFGMNVNAFSIRKERKSYGLFNYIEGIPEDGAEVVYIDDTFNSGSTFAHAMTTVEKELGLSTAPVMYCVLSLSKYTQIKYTDTQGRTIYVQVKSLYNINMFDLAYDESKYWLPKDCQKIKEIL